jgi:hypothetical protein
MSSTEREGISLNGCRYFLASEAAADFGFSGDYIARLARQGKISGRRVGKKWYVEPESLRAYLKVLGEPSCPSRLPSALPERTSAQRIAHAMHVYGRHTMSDWSPPDEGKQRLRSVSPVLPLASVALAIIFVIAAAYATFNGTRASTIASLAQSQFAAASADTSFFGRAAEFLWQAVCPIFRSCDQYDVRSADSQHSGGANPTFVSASPAQQAATTVSTNSPPAGSTSFAATLPAAGNVPVAERVIERIVERALPTYTISYPSDGGGVSAAVLNGRLDQHTIALFQYMLAPKTRNLPISNSRVSLIA